MGHLQSPLMQLYQKFWTPFYSLCSAMTAAMFMRPQNREHSVPFLFFPLSVFLSFSEAPPPLCLSFLRLPLFNVLFIFLLFCSAYSSRHSPPPLSHVACCPSLVPSLFHSRCSLYSVVFFLSHILSLHYVFPSPTSASHLHCLNAVPHPGRACIISPTSSPFDLAFIPRNHLFPFSFALLRPHFVFCCFPFLSSSMFSLSSCLPVFLLTFYHKLYEKTSFWRWKTKGWCFL